MFVFCTTLLCIFVFSFCWVYINKIMDAEQTTIWTAMTKTPASIVLIIYTFISVWFVGGLFVFHLYLMSANQMTYGNFRYRYNRLANPFNRGVIENFAEVFFTSIPPSKNNFRAGVQRDEGLDVRLRGGGGFMSLNMGKEVGDIEMGRKAVAWDSEVGGVSTDLEAIMSNELLEDKDGFGFSGPSPDLNRVIQSEANVHPRRGSWGRSSGNWEMPLEILGLAAGVGGSERRNDEVR